MLVPVDPVPSPPPPPAAAADTGLSRVISWFKAVGVTLIVLHHFARSLWFAAGTAPPPINQWQYLDLGVPHAERAAFVPLFPAWVEWCARWGYVGVHLFMAASILGLALSLRTTAAPRWGAFMARRFRKIWIPACVSIAVFTVLLKPHDVGAALRKASGWAYLSPQEFFSINSPLWFLVLVFQLYVLWPWVARWSARGCLVAAALCLPLAWMIRAALSAPTMVAWHPYAGHAFIGSWLPMIFFGAWLVKAGPSAPRRTLGGAAALAGLALWLLAQRGGAAYGAGDAALAVALVGLAAAVADLRWPLPGLVVGLTAASFPIYLYHRPLVGLFIGRWPGPDAQQTIGLAALTLCVLAAMMAAAAWHRWRAGSGPQAAGEEGGA